jgi:hypothetical protein
MLIFKWNDKDKGCEIEDATEYLSQNTSKGTEVNVTLCFKARDFENSVIKDFNFWRQKNKPNSVVVTELSPARLSDMTKSMAKKFTLSKADEEWADDEVLSARWEKIKECVLYVVSGLVFTWIFSWLMGWIVRGFFGIPSGHDFKP